MMTPELLAASVIDLQAVGSKYVLLQLKLSENYPQNPGQYCFLELQDEAGAFLKPYSIASEPRHNGTIELCLLTGDERTQKALRDLSLGAQVGISRAQGRFQFPAPSSPAVFIAGGSGISPLRSMIRDRFLNSGDKAGPTALLYGCEHAAEIPYFDEFQDLARQYSQFQVSYFVEHGAEPTSPVEIQLGLVTQGIMAHVGSHQNYYLCGPPAMMTACSQELLAQEVKVEQIFTDQY